MSIWPTWSLTGDDAALARYVVPDEVAGLVRDLPPAALVDSRITQLRAVYEALAAHGIVYDHEEPTDDAGRQAIREPGEVLWAPGRGTCLDLALVMAGACLKAGLHPVIVLVDSTSGGASHALLGVWVRDVDGEEGGSSGVWHTPPPAWDRLAGKSGSGRRPPLVLVDPVGIAKGLATTSTRGLNADFDEATRSAARYLTPPPSDGTAAAWTWRVGVDIKHLWRAGATHPTTDRPAGDPLREPYITLDTVPERARTPMQLLRADYGVVPFQARDELTVLTDWCHSVAAGELTGVAVVHGSGGAGKTRLALELAHRMHTRHDWYTGYLKNDDPLDWLGTVVTPTLIVVDYADAASERTRELLRVLSLRRGTPAAVLMTARSVDGDWLNKLRSSWTHRGQLCNELRLRLAPEHPARQRLFRSALGAYATDRVTAAADLEASIDALVPDQWSTLDYVLLGLLAARRQGPLPSTRGELYDEVLVHEHRYWAQTYEDLTTTGKAPSAVLARAAASLTLRAPTTDAQAHAALSAVDELSVDSRWREAVRTTLTACLRPGPGEPLVVRPDPIADHLTLARLADDPDLLARILDNLEPDALLQTLHHLNRAAAADPDTAESRLLAWINAGPDRWPAVLRVAATQGGAVLGVLEASVRQPTGPAWLDDLAEALPDAHTGLVHLAHAVEARRLQDLRSDQATPPATLAAQLTRFSRRQADIGEHGAALDSITEAVDHYVILAQTNPAAFLPNLAGSLHDLSNQQSETGDRDAALTSITEAVHHHRALAQTNPAAFLPNLAGSLNNLSVRQSDIGNRDAALASISEAVQLRRTLAQTNPAVFLPDLAGSLHNLSNQQSETGDRDAALTSITEAVHHHRALAQTNPAVFLPNLAGSLHNLSGRQSETGDRDAALTSITEAVAHYRALAQTNPAVFLRNLAGALNNLSVQQSETGDRDAALTSISEAVQLRRALAQSNPAVFLPDLAESLDNLSGRQSETGDRDAALTSITEAVAHYRALAQTNPAAFLPDLAGSLNNLSNQQSETGDRDAALTSITEAVAHYRALGPVRRIMAWARFPTLSLEPVQQAGDVIHRTP
ncbi:tetratricopeptide repeat protein [Streptomyces sp. NBC_01369]|uniref:tetratricopeptide repeat protein n=1 Tax=Streptomyces sp. NBC_01369 TaxID=2903842 RepID=UPI00324B18FF